MRKLDILEVLKKGFDALANYPVLLGFTAFGILNFILNQQKELSFFFWVILIFQVLLSAYIGAFIVRFVFDSTYKDPSWEEVNQVVLSRYLILFLTGIVYGIAVGVGMIALIVPGIFLFIKLIFYDAAIVIEGDDLAGSLRRSWQIAQGNWWRLFALVAVLTLPGLLISFSENVIPAPIYWFTFTLASGFLFVWTQAVFCYAYLSLKELAVVSEAEQVKE